MSTKYPWDSEAPRAPPPSAVAKLRRTRARGILAKASDDNIIPLGGRGKHFKGHAKRGKHEIRKAHEQTPKALKRKLPISAQGLPASGVVYPPLQWWAVFGDKRDDSTAAFSARGEFNLSLARLSRARREADWVR